MVLLPVLSEKDWTTECNKCKCVWSSGKKSADCRNLRFSQIPNDLSKEVREIDFSGNPLYQLRQREFDDAGLQNVHKLKLANCSIEEVDPSAFERLMLLIELDLSNNNIKKLDNMVFKANVKLRILYLSHNKLRQLGSNMFPNMTHLQRIHLDDNRLEVISEDTFGPTCPITHLSLENNRLTYLGPSFTDRMQKLSSIELGGNPWMCDCKLESFRKLALVNNWITQPIECQQPERLRGRKWADESVIFACEPKIIEPSPSAVLEIDSVNYTIPCKVEGDPRPSVVWMSNGRSVDTHRNSQKYHVSSSKDWPYWDNLTIINVSYRDRGDYKCIATNPGGSDERNVTVYLRGTDYLGGGTLSSTSMSNTMLLIILLAAGAIILLVVIMLLICCCCKRTDNHERLTKNNPNQKEMQEFIRNNSDSRHDDGRITSVNPVSKPPRQHSVPTSVISGGTEVSDAKTKLIDDESIYNGDEEMKLYDYPALKAPKRNPMVDDYKTDHYPPDLLSFPPRATHQISPAGSSASTVADTTRLPHHGMHSPIHSPSYDHSNALYRTLPYSRSHSPFASNGVQPLARVSRPGAYVTIPRRPRSSWSSEPPNMPEVGEPLYDNLGLRTTAKGASALSLNKLDATSPAGTPTRTARPNMPLLSPQPCDTIAEHESPPRALTASTLPRNLAAHRALSPQFDLRSSWARSSDTDSRRDSTASLIPTDGKSPKIPPRPPPKPKKRTSTGPLFEDEGEDGTEV